VQNKNYLDELTAHTAKKNRVCERLRLERGCDELKPPTNHSTDLKTRRISQSTLQIRIFFNRSNSTSGNKKKSSGELPQRGRRAREVLKGQEPNAGGARQRWRETNRPTPVG
jgi:hypothetical protein